MIMNGYVAYNLTSVSRVEILRRFKPKFENNVVAHHITHQFGVSDTCQLPPKPAKVEVVGYASDGKIECLVVEVDGSSKRPDGALYHVTLSHTNEATPKMSNDLLKKGWEPCPPFLIEASPVFNAFSR